jgi:hypothetical protein
MSSDLRSLAEATALVPIPSLGETLTEALLRKKLWV